MCGISGYLTTKPHAREAQKKYSNILSSTAIRGTDASGIAFTVEKNRFYYAKSPIPADQLVREEVYTDLIKEFNPTILIGHARAKTQGDEKDNRNNHPLVSKNGLALVHNGVLTNEDDIKKEFNLETDGEVDSEVILRLVEYYIYEQGKSTQDAIRLMAEHIRGSMAIALVNAKEPKSLYLMASSNPINFAFHIPTKTIYFASTEEILKKGLIEYEYYFKGYFHRNMVRDEYIFQSLADDTGLKLSPNGWEDFKIKRPSYQYAYSSGRGAACETNYTRDDDSYLSLGAGKKNTPIISKSNKPSVIEAQGEDAIVKALKDYKDFDPQDEVKKPSLYLSELLLYRLEYIQELFTSGDYNLFYNTNADILVLQSETRRIIDTLTNRQKKTKRTDLILPKFEDVWLLENDKYKNALKDGKPDAGGFKELKWILTHSNPKAMELLSKAEKLKEDEEELQDELYDLESNIDEVMEKGGYYCSDCDLLGIKSRCLSCGSTELEYIPPEDSEENTRKDYFCELCRSLKSSPYCFECGTSGLRTVEELSRVIEGEEQESLLD